MDAAYAVLFMTDAVDFHAAGISLKSLPHFGPKKLLLCHSVELAMKAFLMATGSTLDQVEDLRHDLKKLSNRCRRSGLVLKHPRAKQVLNMIAPVHKQHLLRYKEPGGVMMPSDIEFNEFVSSLLEDIWPAIHSAEKQRRAAARARAPLPGRLSDTGRRGE
jgi:hypothetical protein